MKNVNSVLFNNPNFNINYIDDLLDYQLCVTMNYETYRKLFAPLANSILWKFSYPIKFKL
jgi:hypothetical protein